MQDAALANERVAIFCLDRGDNFWAKSYMKRAHELWTEWQAFAKADSLVDQYPTLFQLPKQDSGSGPQQKGSSSLRASASRSLRAVTKFEARFGEKHKSLSFDDLEED